jgi:uncharacterized lipoprotein YmbA
VTIQRNSVFQLTLVVMLFAGSLAGCSRSPTVKVYTLSPVAVASQGGMSDLAVVVGPADLPRALNRNQIVTRASDTRINIDEYHVWAAALDSEFLRVLGDNIAAGLGSDRVVSYPAESPFDLDYRVLIDVLQFDGALGDSVVLKARWTIVQQNGEAVAVEMFESTQTISGGSNYDALVAAHSAAIGELSQDVVAELKSLGKPASD